MKQYSRVYLVSFLLFVLCNSGICLQSSTDTIKVDSAQKTNIVSPDSVITDSTVDSIGTYQELRSSLDEIQEQQNSLSKDLKSLQTTVKLSNDEASGSNFWLFITIICLSILTFFSVGISFYLYRRQIVMVKNTEALVPEKWGGYLESVGKQLKKFGDAVGNKLGKVEEKTQNNTERIQSMIDTYMQLQDTLDEKDAEIKRLRSGYDSQIYRDFLYRFIRVDQTINELFGEEDITKEDLELVKRLMEDAFLECGVERFKPEIGEDYTSARGVDENPEKIGTQKEEREFQIAEIKEEGYELNRGEQAEVLVPAKVKIYVNEN